MNWCKPPIPDMMEGEQAMVILNEKAVADAGLEYYGAPVACCLVLRRHIAGQCVEEGPVQLRLVERGPVRREDRCKLRSDMWASACGVLTPVRQMLRAARPIATRRNPRQCITTLQPTRLEHEWVKAWRPYAEGNRGFLTQPQ